MKTRTCTTRDYSPTTALSSPSLLPPRTHVTPTTTDIAFDGISEPAELYRHLTFLGERTSASVALPVRSNARGSWRPPAMSQPLDAESAAFFDALCCTGGLRMDRYRKSILMRRRAACLRALRVACPVEGSRAIGRNRDAAERALGAVMIGVTAFFRDPAVFGALRPMLAPLHARRGGLDAASIACSDGSELYSLAMLLAEEGLLPTSRLWGLDCRPAAVLTAQRGIYHADAVKHLPDGLRDTHFTTARSPRMLEADHGTRDGDGTLVRAREHLRTACRWRIGDAFDLPTDAAWHGMVDVMMCRNLTIYLTPESSAELWELLVARVRPGGVLVVGKAERPSPNVAGLLRKTGPCIYQKA